MLLLLFMLSLCTPMVFSRSPIFDGKNPKYAEDVARFVEKKEFLKKLTNEILGVSQATSEKSFGNISEIEENPFIFEGDIIVTEDQLDEMILDAQNRLMEKKTPDLIREKRAAFVKNSSHLWIMPIPYYIGAGVNEKAVLAGIERWEQETCIRFERRPSNKSDENMILFVIGKQCASSVGMLGGVQEIVLNGGCYDLGSVCHEIAHALGMVHEHARPDRDEHITINTNNIDVKRIGNFLPQPSFDYRRTYDYGSLMHYSQNSFAINKSIPTMITKNPYYQETIGHSDGPSFIDVHIMNEAYCGNPNNCDQCKCPPPYTGRLCDTVTSTCGNDLTATADPQTLTVESAKTCTIVINVPSRDHRVNVTITELDFNADDRCLNDYVDLYWQDDVHRAPTRFCMKKPAPIVSFLNKFLVVYKSRRTNSRFSMTYHAV